LGDVVTHAWVGAGNWKAHAAEPTIAAAVKVLVAPVSFMLVVLLRERNENDDLLSK
jgi:hypothetical protein